MMQFLYLSGFAQVVFAVFLLAVILNLVLPNKPPRKYA